MQYAHEHKTYERKFPKGTSAPLPRINVALWPDFEKYLVGRGLDSQVARTNRWYPSACAGDTLPRIVIPATNSAGLSYWQARAMVPTEKRYQSPPVQRGDSVVTVWPGELNMLRPIVVVEGPLDALAAASVGFVGVALMGKEPPVSVLDFVATLRQKRAVLVVADADAPGAAAFTVAYLASKGRRCKLIQTSPHKDLAAMPLIQREKLLQGADDVS